MNLFMSFSAKPKSFRKSDYFLYYVFFKLVQFLLCDKHTAREKTFMAKICPVKFASIKITVKQELTVAKLQKLVNF